MSVPEIACAQAMRPSQLRRHTDPTEQVRASNSICPRIVSRRHFSRLRDASSAPRCLWMIGRATCKLFYMYAGTDRSQPAVSAMTAPTSYRL